MSRIVSKTFHVPASLLGQYAVRTVVEAVIACTMGEFAKVSVSDLNVSMFWGDGSTAMCETPPELVAWLRQAEAEQALDDRDDPEPITFTLRYEAVGRVVEEMAVAA